MNGPCKITVYHVHTEQWLVFVTVNRSIDVFDVHLGSFGCIVLLARVISLGHEVDITAATHEAHASITCQSYPALW